MCCDSVRAAGSRETNTESQVVSEFLHVDGVVDAGETMFFHRSVRLLSAVTEDPQTQEVCL